MADTATAKSRNEAAKLGQIARKLLWWQSGDETLRDPIRFCAQVMTYGTWNDVILVRRALGDDALHKALRNPPAGVFDERSWNYWHLVFCILPIPPLPTRKLE